MSSMGASKGSALLGDDDVGLDEEEEEKGLCGFGVGEPMPAAGLASALCIVKVQVTKRESVLRLVEANWKSRRA